MITLFQCSTAFGSLPCWAAPPKQMTCSTHFSWKAKYAWKCVLDFWFLTGKMKMNWAWYAGPVNSEFFLHSSELDVKVQSSVCVMSGTYSVLPSLLSQQWAAREGVQRPVWYSLLVALTWTWWDSNRGLWLTLAKWAFKKKKKKKQANPGLQEQRGLKSNTFLDTTVLWHLI